MKSVLLNGVAVDALAALSMLVAKDTCNSACTSSDRVATPDVTGGDAALFGIADVAVYLGGPLPLVSAVHRREGRPLIPLCRRASDTGTVNGLRSRVPNT
jgi:hypothetical protein